jgi:hypothetical protein
MIVSFTPKETVFISDTFRYYLKHGTIENVLNHTLEINHNNLKEHIETYETDAPKIHRITKNIALICGGDGRFSDISEGLNECENTATQILQRLKRKGKLGAYWSCHIPQLGKLTSITYKNGEIETQEQTTDNIWFDSFAPEIKEIFFKKYINLFYLATTQEKIKIINEFFKEVTTLFNGLAGGTPQIAILNEKGFQQLTTQNFTTYALNWCPEKIETTATSQSAWSSTNWTDVLELAFECESTMLCIGFAHADAGLFHSGSTQFNDTNWELTLDGNAVPATYAYLGGMGEQWEGMYSAHVVLIVAKGSHTLRMRMRAAFVGVTAYARHRRLTILKGFYQGGAT